jgi:hypothetical protein
MNLFLSFFSTDYRDGAVYISDRKLPAGQFALLLLNQYYKGDTAAKVSVYKRYNWRVTETLSAGYLNPEDLPEAANEIHLILKILPLIQPFKLLNIPAEEKRIATLQYCNQTITVTGINVMIVMRKRLLQHIQAVQQPVSIRQYVLFAAKNTEN